MMGNIIKANFTSIKESKNKFLMIYCDLILILYIVLANAGTINFFGFPFKIQELMAIIALPFLFWQFKKEKISEFCKLSFIWFAYGLILLFVNYKTKGYELSGVVKAAAYNFRMIFTFVFAMYCAKLYKKNNLHNHVYYLVLNCYIALCIIGFIQLKVFPAKDDAVAFLMKFGVYFPDGWDSHVGRIYATYIDPNFLASALALPFSMSIYSFLKEKKPIDLIGATFVAVTVIYAYSRSGFLALAGIIGLYALYILYLHRNKIKLIHIVLLLVLVIVGLVVLWNSDLAIIKKFKDIPTDTSANARLSNLKLSWNVIKENMLFGLGYNAIETCYPVFTDASVFVVWICTGIFGLILWTAAYGRVTYKLIKNDKVFIGFIIIVSIIVSTFNNLMFYVLFMVPFVLIIELYVNE